MRGFKCLGKTSEPYVFFVMLPTPYVITVCSFIFANTLITALDRTIREFSFLSFSFNTRVDGCMHYLLDREKMGY